MKITFLELISQNSFAIASQYQFSVLECILLTLLLLQKNLLLLLIIIITLHFIAPFMLFLAQFLLYKPTVNYYIGKQEFKVFLFICAYNKKYELQLGEWSWCTGNNINRKVNKRNILPLVMSCFSHFVCVSLCQHHSENWRFTNKGISFTWTFCTSETTEFRTISHIPVMTVKTEARNIPARDWPIVC